MPDKIKRIEFSNVSFSYPDAAAPALNNISLSLDGGKMVAIVGPSGSGKSTLIDLIPRLRAPTHGTIRINETNVGDFKINDLRNSCAFVTQNPSLISGSIYEYISYGMKGVGPDEARRAAEQANAHEFIEALPNGYDTVMGEGGVGLSGGQRQRVELARALARNASILILDEPTSSVDGRSAELIHEAINKLREETDTTILIIGHQLGAIRNADKIVVINGGCVEKEGIHDELMASEGWY
ncbi:MAG: ATP-binding cassette domain-containing protein, partial [Alphaproteobacteria bacterium]|nr:ATP-binding cassette domain-containing protein [Alphaproteobacteria bacterium]